MARHNREGRGRDQRGFRYRISYQPDWLRQVKVSRELPTGRRSTLILFRNPGTDPRRPPGRRVRTRITCPEQGLDVEVAVRDGRDSARRLSVTCVVPGVEGDGEERVTFTLERRRPLPG